MMKEVYPDIDNAINAYRPLLPTLLSSLEQLEPSTITIPQPENPDLQKLFPNTYDQPYLTFTSSAKQNLSHPPLKVGVMLSGGPAPGGHSVITGLLDGILALNTSSQLFGFINGGEGLMHNNSFEINLEYIQKYRNTGGFNCLGTGRTKIITPEGKIACLKTVQQLDLDGLVIIGGDGSNTATAILAEYFAQNNSKTIVTGVPKTIDGDLSQKYLDITFGFDTATKFYSSIISNISRDAISYKGHYHFIKLMGRAASHVALECALQTHPNITLIGEEIAEKNISLKEIVSYISEIISERASIGKYYGVVLIPEGIMEFIPEIQELIKEIQMMPENNRQLQALSKNSQALIQTFPSSVVHQLLNDRDAHGNIYVSKISVDKFLIHLVKEHLNTHYKKVPFNAISHFLGYEGRSGTPTKFDNDYGYALGYGSALLIRHQCNGYLSCISGLTKRNEEWCFIGSPITKILTLKTNNNEKIPVIKKHLVNIHSTAFKKFAIYRKIWSLGDSYRYLGPLQLFAPLADRGNVIPPFSLILNNDKDHECHQWHMCDY